MDFKAMELRSNWPTSELICRICKNESLQNFKINENLKQQMLIFKNSILNKNKDKYQQIDEMKIQINRFKIQINLTTAYLSVFFLNTLILNINFDDFK